MESMKVCNLLRSRSLCQGHFNINIMIMVFSEITGPMKCEILCGASMLRGNKFLCTKSGSNAQHNHHAHKCSKWIKVFFSRTGGRIFMKLGM